MPPPYDIRILREPVTREELRQLVTDGFGDMVKYVVDLERRLVPLGGELHADAEARLLEGGRARRTSGAGTTTPAAVRTSASSTPR